MSRDTLYYFAYGSNLHPVRLQERVSSARLIGTALLDGYRLEFHKSGSDGSGKCNLYFSDVESDIIYGAVYAIHKEQKEILDRFESKGSGYDDPSLSLLCGGERYDCFTYIAQPEYIDDSLLPYHWYRELVVSGARHLGFPEDYVSALESVKAGDDPDIARNREHCLLLGRMM